MIRKILELPIKFYRKFISPLKPPCCRFNPTCSQYALDALRERGVIVGLGLTIWRILRCNPFGKGGYDPVPPKKNLKISVQSIIKKGDNY